MENPRLIVARLLLRVEQQGAWTNLSLDAQLRQHNLTGQQSAFASALFYGVVERQLTLDACIAGHSKMRLGAMQPSVRAVLRLGVYQLLYMNSVPDSAAVDESVKLVRLLRAAKAAGFVNGVLRSFLRAEKRIPVPDEPLEQHLSIAYSCPPELVQLWLDAYGEQATRRVLEGSLGRAPITLRVNTVRTTEAELIDRLEQCGVQATKHKLLPDCLVVMGTGAVQELDVYREGLFHVQDVSSQLCVGALAARPGQRVLDACAAPGGKSFTIAQHMENCGEVVACDIHRSRAQLVEKRAEQMGLTIVSARVHDMSKDAYRLGTFDRVLCDVPCSGLGVIRRKPEIKYKLLEEFSDLPRIQYNILANSAQYCKVGGVLVYSTCTLNPAENSEVTARFLQNNPDFVPLPLGGELSGSHERTLLGEYDADGFYLCVMGRKGGSPREA